MAENRYHKPDWFTRNIFNKLVQGLTAIGISVMGSRELRVRGRSSGQWRTTPVNLLTVRGVEYLVAPRGETQWVRNLRAAGTGELRLGRHVQPFTATELTDDLKAPVLQSYLHRWYWEVGQFFDNIGKNASLEQIGAISPGFPVFKLN